MVTTLPHHPAMRIPPEYDVPTPDTRAEGTITVTRLRPRLAERENLLDRLNGEAQFARQAARFVRSLNCDVVIASSPYFFLGPALLGAARRIGAKYVWDVRDLTWLYPKATGRRTFGSDVVFDVWMKRVAAKADALVTTSQAQLDHLHSGVVPARVIPNGVTPDEIKRYGQLPVSGPMGERPRVTYIGLFGFMHGLTTLVHTAELVPGADFHFYGDGPEHKSVVEAAQQLGLTNTFFHGHVNKEGVLEAYRQADILIAPIRDRDAFRMIQPAKIWECLSTGRPVIHAGNGESADILKQNDLAWVVQPEQPAQLASAIREVASSPSRVTEVVLRARQWVAQNRNRETLATEWNALLTDLTKAT